MGHYRLVLQQGLHPQHEWTLPYERAVMLGRRDSEHETPDVDLTLDRQVSRQHARIWFEGDGWWLEDLGSRHGTRIGRRAAQVGQPVRLEPGANIRVGQTGLSLFPPDWHQLRTFDTIVELALSHVIDEPLATSRRGCEVISRLVVRNLGASAGARRLRFRFEDRAAGDAPVPPLDAGESRSLPAPGFQFTGTRRSRSWHALAVQIDGQELQCSGSIGSWFLGSDEWSLLPEHRAWLAGFVMPTRPEVIRALSEATAGLDQAASSVRVLEQVYGFLSSTWHIDYRLEPMAPAVRRLTGEPPVQRVRLPDVVLTDRRARVGSGTCLDLALLIGAMVEAFHRQPLVAIAERGTSRHALVGCWRQQQRGLEPVIIDRQRLLAEADWVDPNGCTRDPAQRADFDRASARAVADLRAGLVFALDIAAARGEGILPRADQPRL